jgi:signal transduction histidine kinase
MSTPAARLAARGDESEAGADSVRDLLATVLHEVRTPLSCLAATVEVLLGNFEELEPREARAMLARMQRSAAWLQALVDNLTVAAQLDTCQLHLAPAPVALGECVETALALVAPLLERAGQRVEVAGPLGLWARADGRRVEQVLVNLLMNASKYGGPGRPIRLRVEGVGGRVRVWVQDGGPGIGAAERERIFGRYERGQVARASGVGGLGLGLHIVKTLVERQGGQVGVESAPGQGAAFWFTLPLAPPRALPPEVKPVQRPAAKRRAEKRSPARDTSGLVAIGT